MSEPMPKLLPCPFCGGDAKIIGSANCYSPSTRTTVCGEPDMTPRGDEEKREYWDVFCRQCGVRAVSAQISRTREDAITAWNTRAMSRTAAPEGLREDGGEITCFGNTYATTDPASVRRATLEEVAKFYESKGEKYIPAKFVAEHCRALAPAPGEG